MIRSIVNYFILSTFFFACGTKEVKRPNILFAISDDQSIPHAGAYGYAAAKTPNFDRIASEGILFNNAFTAAPGCSPSRASVLTGRHIWQIEDAGTHASEFPTKYICYTDLLDSAGYHVGYTAKGWGPGNWKISGKNQESGGERI
jgi:N-sulfoglucosamine sulfohydrolase